MGRLVGFDYGRARIGVALSDEKKIIASPLTTLKMPKKKAILLFQELEKSLAPFAPFDCFLIGLPLLLNGKEGEMALEAKQFGEALFSYFKIPVAYWDERLSSSQADRLMKEDLLTRKERASHADTVAATLVLQNYLDYLSSRQF